MGFGIRNVETTQNMFADSAFNQDISNWNLAKCEVGADMFRGSAMNYNERSYEYFKILPTGNTEYEFDVHCWF